MTVAVLEREMFSEAEAARLLQLSQSTLHYWLEGGDRRGKLYLPVLREQSTGVRTVTWGEFVEAGLLRQYRRVHQVPMAELRAVIDRLRERLGTPYPLAHAQPFVGPGRELLEKAQAEADLRADFCLVAIASGQLVLTSAADTFFSRVEWKEGLALGWRPHADEKSPVRMRPDVRYGLPMVAGVRTKVLWEHLEAGESVDEVATSFDLTPRQVRWANSYETGLRAA